MSQPINITKVNYLRNGNPYRHYATTEKEHHGADFSSGKWNVIIHTLDGSWLAADGVPCPYDLVGAKTWRAWKEGEAPLRIMIRRKGITTVETKRTRDCDLVTLFIHYVRVHEDGTETPCGVEE